jgi:hypothetical protein
VRYHRFINRDYLLRWFYLHVVARDLPAEAAEPIVDDILLSLRRVVA